MEFEPSSAPEEVKQLQGWINDLARVLAPPVNGSVQDPSRFASALLDVLLRMLRLDFAYVKVGDSFEGPGTEWARAAPRQDIDSRDIGRALEHALTDDIPTASLALPNPIGEGVVRLALVRLGPRDELGRLAAASQRTDFPTDIETFLLQLAANQATIALQEARYVVKYRAGTPMRKNSARRISNEPERKNGSGRMNGS